jgi:cytochrome c-type protein NapC
MAHDSVRGQPGNAKGSKRRLIPFFLAASGFVFLGVLLVALTNEAVMWTSSDQFCGKTCHSMTWATAAYQRSLHYKNQVGVRASCGDCHIPYDSSHATATEYAKLLMFKAHRGAKDFWNEIHKTIATEQEWEKRRPELRATFEAYLKKHNSITCRGCHQLDSFRGPRNPMKLLIHQNILKADDTTCLSCHRNVGHVYEEPDRKLSGWYSVEQAAAGAKIVQKSCTPCHGARLEGGTGPSLTGASWLQLYGGAKLLRVWGEIKGPMANYAGTSFTTQQSLDILAYLLQQNGLPAGSQPLRDTQQLSDTLPTK